MVNVRVLEVRVVEVRVVEVRVVEVRVEGVRMEVCVKIRLYFRARSSVGAKKRL